MYIIVNLCHFLRKGRDKPSKERQHLTQIFLAFKEHYDMGKVEKD